MNMSKAFQVVVNSRPALVTAAFASQRIGITPVILLFAISLLLLPKVHSRVI